MVKIVSYNITTHKTCYQKTKIMSVYVIIIVLLLAILKLTSAKVEVITLYFSDKEGIRDAKVAEIINSMEDKGFEFIQMTAIGNKIYGYTIVFRKREQKKMEIYGC